MNFRSVAILIGLVLTGNACATESMLTVDAFALKYSAEHSELGRRNLCIEAMDAGLVYSGMPVSEINKLFGTHFSFSVPPAFGATERDAIRFAPEVKVSQKPVAVQAPAPKGWYFAFEFDRNEHVWTYYVSNAHGK